MKNRPEIEYAKISVINYTKDKVQIPLKIEKIMNLGLKNAICGIADKTLILHKNEILFTNWLNHAQTSGLDPFKIAEIRSLLTIEMQKMKNCFTPNSDCKEVKNFLDSNKNLLFVEIDKSKNLALMDISDYIHKLIKVFSPDKFLKLSRDPVETDLTQYYKLIKKIEPFLSIDDFRRIKAYHSITKRPRYNKSS